MPDTPLEVGYLNVNEGGAVSQYENTQFSSSVPIAIRFLESGGDPSCFRTNDTLRKDEWELFDDVLVEVGRERLRVVSDFVDAGMVLNVPNALGTTVIQHETVNDFTAADVTMDGVTRVTQDRVDFLPVNTPLPVISKDFELSVRALEASRTRGQPLDTTHAFEATRVVTEKAEEMMINGLPAVSFGSGSGTANLYGLRTHPNRNTFTAADWSLDSSSQGSNILNDVLSMMNILQGDQMFGPYKLYVPANFWIDLLDDFKTNSDKSIIQRLLEIPLLTGIDVADKLPDNEVILMQMTRNVADVIMGMQPTLVNWELVGGLLLKFKVMMIMAPRPKASYTGQSGIVHGT